jgi:hypothetical protein
VFSGTYFGVSGLVVRLYAPAVMLNDAAAIE